MSGFILGIRKRKPASVAANLSRQKVLEVPTEGKKSSAGATKRLWWLPPYLGRPRPPFRTAPGYVIGFPAEKPR